MTGRDTRWGRWPPRIEIRLKELKLEFIMVLAAEMTQVLDSIAWLVVPLPMFLF